MTSSKDRCGLISVGVFADSGHMLLIQRTKTQRKSLNGSRSLLVTDGTTAFQEIRNIGQDQNMNNEPESIVSAHKEITLFNILLGGRL